METRKLVLVIAPEGSVVLDLVRDLKELDYLISHAASVEVAQQVVEQHPQLSLVVLEHEMAASLGQRFLSELLKQHGSMPTLLVGPPVDGLEVSRTVESTDRDAFLAATRELLFEELYPPGLVRAFVSAGNVVMTTTFGLGVDISDPVLNHADRLPGNLTAIIPFSGATCKGHLLVSGDSSLFAEIAIELGFPEDLGPIQLSLDIIGEISNQILGQLINTTEQFNGVGLGLPYVMYTDPSHSGAMSLHISSQRPAVSTQLTLDNGSCFNLGLWFESPPPEEQLSNEEEQLLADGGLLFL